jgi:hypothetical protein
MRAAATLLLLLFSAACPPKPPTPPASLPTDAGACAVPAAPTASDVCDGMFTAAGYACVRCPNVSGCVDTTLQVYCAAPSCAADPLCRIESEDSPLQGKRRRK